ncbi:MAG: hypothetical protein ACYTG2_01705 [Planctomycetota bacterium]|jgi:YHS domain-containing protein
MKSSFRLHAALLLAGLACSAPVVAAQDRAADSPAPDKAALAARAAGPDDAAIVAQRPTYPLETCIVSGEPLGAMNARKDVLRDGRLVSFCCNNCITEFDKTPAKYHKQLDEAVVAAQAPTYPLTTCPISDEPLEKPKYAVVGTRLIAVCCNSCKKDVAADPKTALAKVDAALMDVQARTYPLDACVVDGKPLGDKPVRNLHGLTLVQFCSAECVAHFRAEPPGFLEKLETARAAGHDKGRKAGKGEHGDKGDKGDKGRPEKGRP